MRCRHCPLHNEWNTETDKGESCEIFGDSWDSPFMYEDNKGNITGCYLETCYIKKVVKQRDKYYNDIYETACNEQKQKEQP